MSKQSVLCLSGKLLDHVVLVLAASHSMFRLSVRSGCVDCATGEISPLGLGTPPHLATAEPLSLLFW